MSARDSAHAVIWICGDAVNEVVPLKMAFTTKVSIVIACRNEKAFIGACLDSMLANDYPQDLLEVLVADGRSDDGTRAIVASYSKRFPFIKLVDNPGQIASTAFNLGVQHASGDLIMIMGAHSTYATDYISRCVRASNESGADNVGGVIRVIPRKPGLLGNALAFALGHPFGVGNAHFRFESGGRRSTDTVFGGCYRREVFQKVGLFNEQLVFNQDIEFNLRLGRAGGKILLDPQIVSDYRARSDLKSYWKHNFRNGSWVVFSSLYCDSIPFSWRHLIPLVFVTALAGSAALSFILPYFWWVFLGISGSYLVASLIASATIAIRKRDFRYFVLMPLAFVSLHVAYGLGSLIALVRMLLQRDLRGRAYRRIFSDTVPANGAWGGPKPKQQSRSLKKDF
jgi:glycosyltransferase involved in cell wall biosynthesis